jgi:hypothetical protein
LPKHVFISYAQNDKRWGELVCAQLEDAGISCWIAPRDIAPGVTWPAAITEAIGQCSAMIVIFSTHANQSPHMAREVECADNRRVPILPVRVENVPLAGDLEYFLGNRQWFDLHERTIERRIAGLPEAISGLLAEGILRGQTAETKAPPQQPTSKPLETVNRLWWPVAGVAAIAIGVVLFFALRPKSTPAPQPAEVAVIAPPPVQTPAVKPEPTPAPVHATPAKTAAVVAATPPPPTLPAKEAGNLADFNGRWKAVVKYSWGVTHPEIFALRADQDEVDGTASYLGTGRGILDGKIQGNKITFTTKTYTILGDATYEEKHHYKGRFSGNAIEFILQTDSGYDSRPPEMFTAERVEPASP